MQPIPVYKKLPKDGKPGKTNLGKYQGKKGIYFIYESGVLIYIGSSKSNLYKTVLRHFQQWNDTAQLRRISYKNKLGRKVYTVAFKLRPSKTPEQIEAEEYKLIRKYEPRDNKLDVYCDMTGKNCESKLLRAKEKVKPKKQNKKKKPPQQPQYIPDDEVPF